MQNFLNINNNIAGNLNNFLNLKDKYDKNKKELSKCIETFSFKASNDKEFFKELFKIMDKYLNKMDENVFNTLGVYTDVPILSKTILFLKYKETKSYKDKIKMIKTIAGDITIAELLFHEKIILNQINFISQSAINYKENDEYTASIKTELDIGLLRKHLLLFKNTLLMLKCVLFNFHKKEIMYFENTSPKYKIVPIKTIYEFELEFKLASKLELDDAIRFLKEYEKENNHSIFSINNKLATILTASILKEDTINDDYEKCLLDKFYNEQVTNNMNDIFKTSNSFMIFTDIFKRRKVLIPKNGIIILVENPESPIESILLSEKEILDINHLYFITRYKDKTEVINSIPLQKDISYNESIKIGVQETKADYFNTISYILDFLEIGKSDMNSILKYSVISPVYWKYRNKGYISSNDKVNNAGVIVKREFEIEIAPFLRKISGKPSNEALELADKLGIFLEKGYTIVKPHTRTYNSQK